MPEVEEVLEATEPKTYGEWLEKRIQPEQAEEARKTEEAPGTSQQEQDEKGKEEKVTPGVQKRIDKAVAKQRDAERRAEEAERRLQEKRVTPPAKETAVADPKAPIEPKLEDFDDWSKFNQAEKKYYKELAAHEAQAAVAAYQKAQTESEAKAKAEEAEKQQVADWSKSEEAARAAHDDYDDKLAEIKEDIKSGKFQPLSQNLIGAIAASDAKAELLYHLSTNRDELERINALPVHLVPYELGKLAGKLEKDPVSDPKPKQITVNPKPPERISGSAASQPSIESKEIPFKEFVRLRNAQIKKG